MDRRNKYKKVKFLKSLEMTYFTNSWILLHFMVLKMFQIMFKIQSFGRHM